MVPFEAQQTTGIGASQGFGITIKDQKFRRVWRGELLKAIRDYSFKVSREVYGGVPRKATGSRPGDQWLFGSSSLYTIPFGESVNLSGKRGVVYIYGRPPVYNINGEVVSKVRPRRLPVSHGVRAYFGKSSHYARFPSYEVPNRPAPQGLTVPAGERLIFGRKVGTHYAPASKADKAEARKARGQKGKAPRVFTFYRPSGGVILRNPIAFNQQGEVAKYELSLSDYVMRDEGKIHGIIESAFDKAFKKVFI